MIVGIMFLLLAGSIMWLLFALPFIICGAECLIFKKNVGRWCMWTVYFCLDLYIRMATGAPKGLAIASIIYRAELVSRLNPATLAVSWVLVISLVSLMIVTVVRFSGKSFAGKKELICSLAVPWVIYAVIRVFIYVFTGTDAFNRLFAEKMQNGVTILKGTVSYFYFIVEVMQTAAFTVAMVNTVRALKKY